MSRCPKLLKPLLAEASLDNLFVIHNTTLHNVIKSKNYLVSNPYIYHHFLSL